MNRQIINWGLTLSVFACSPQQPAEKEDNNESHLFSGFYKVPEFADDQRIQKIESIASEVQKLFEDHGQAYKIPGIAYGIVVDDKLVVSGATGLINREGDLPATTGSLFRIASMTKSFTAMAILKLRDEGKLSLDDPVDGYIPEMAGLEYLTSDASLIDIENLLTMTAGFPEDNPWGDRQLDESDQMLIDLVDEGLSFSTPTSNRYEYSNTGYALLGNIISRVSGRPYQDYIRENILLPLGMDNTYWEYDSVADNQLAIGYRWEDEQLQLEPMLHDGSYGSMGGLITSIEDFSKYVSFHMSAWPARSTEDVGPVQRSTLREMHNPQFSFLRANAKDWNGEPCASMIGYGFGLGISKNCTQRIRVSHGGALPGFGSNYAFFPEYGVGLMAFGNLTYTGPIPYDELEKLLFETLEIQPRQLPASEILLRRKEQIAEWIQTPSIEMEAQIMAENFFLDKSREHRIIKLQAILDQAGKVQKMSAMRPGNQLRATFDLETEKGSIGVFFTLTPEKDPKVQQLEVWFKEGGEE